MREESLVAGAEWDGEWSRSGELEFGNQKSSRLSGRQEVACEPNRRMGAESKLIDHPVPHVIDVPKVHWMVSSILIPAWILQARTTKVKLRGRLHRGSGGGSR